MRTIIFGISPYSNCYRMGTETINPFATLFKLNYAEPNDWSRPLPTGRPNEVMAILTRRVRVE